MTRRPTCADALNGDRRCTLTPNHPGNHSDGQRFWRFAGDPGLPEWLRRVREGRTSLLRDETGRVAL